MKSYMFTRLDKYKEHFDLSVEKYRGLRAEYDRQGNIVIEMVRDIMCINDIFYNVNDVTNITQEEINTLIEQEFEGGKIVGWDDDEYGYIVEHPVERSNEDINAILNGIRIYAMSYRDIWEDIIITVKDATGEENISIDLPKLDISEFLDEDFNFLPEYNEFLNCKEGV